jgi:hypothetical protein
MNGRPDRIDLLATSKGLVSTKFYLVGGRYIAPDGAMTRQANSLDAAAFGLMAAVTLLESWGYTVVVWPYGARAFKEGVKPIRRTNQICLKRDDVMRQVRSGLLPDWFNWSGLDFAVAM